MKVRLTTAIAGVAALALAACGSSSTDSTESSAPSSAADSTESSAPSSAADSTESAAAESLSGKTITMMTSYSEGQIAPLAKKFEESTGATVDITYAGGENVIALLTQTLSAGTAADVIYALPGGTGGPSQIGSLATAGYLEDLSDQAWASQIPEAQKEVLSWDGKVYGFPAAIQPIGAIYDMTLVEEAGLQPPTTWSELLQFCQDARDKGTVAFSAGLGEGWTTQLVTYALTSTLVGGPNPDFEKNVGNGSVFAESGWVDAFAKYKEMQDAGCFIDDALGIDFNTSVGILNQGEALGLVQVGGVLGIIEEQAPETANYVVYPLPATDDAADTYMPAALTATLAVNAQAKEMEGAKAFINFLTEPANLAEFAALVGGTVPTIPDPSYQAPESLVEFAAFAAESRTTGFPDVYWPNPEIQNAHFDAVQLLSQHDQAEQHH